MGLSLQFVLELVDRLSGPAKEAARALGMFEDASRGISSGGGAGALQAEGWIEASRAIAAANDNLAGFVSASAEAVAAVDPLVAVWERANQQINYATRSVEEFEAVSRRVGGGGGPIGAGGGSGGGRGEHGGGLKEALKTAGELGLMMEAPRAIEGIVHAGAGVQGEEVSQKIAGMTAAEIAEAHERAVGYASTFKLFGIAEIGKQIREGRTVFTSDADAKELMPDILKLATLQEKSRPGSGMESAYNFTRAIEEAGISKDVTRAHQFYEDAGRAINFFGGTISGEDYQLAFNRSGIYGRNYDREFTAHILPHLLQTFHGDVTGTMLGTFGQMVVGGHMSGKELATLEKLGMVNEHFVTKRDKRGRAAEIDPGGIVGTELAEHNPYEFAKLLLGKMQAKNLSEAEQTELLTTIFGNRNAAKAIYTLAHDDQQLARTREGIDNPENKGLAAFADVSGDATSAFTELKTALENLYGVASEPMMGKIAWGLDHLAGGISEFTHALDGDKLAGVALSLGTIGGALYGGLKALTGVGGVVGGWLGVAQGAETEVAELGTAAGVASEGLLALAGPLGLMAAALGVIGHEALDPNSLLNQLQNYLNAQPHAWANPMHGVDWSNPVERETALTQEYARQGDQHPIIHGERDMEAARGQALGELARRADEAATAFEKLFEKGNATISPNIDARSLEALEAKLEHVVALINQVNGGTPGLRYTPAPGRGSALHDGPEAR